MDTQSKDGLQVQPAPADRRQQTERRTENKHSNGGLQVEPAPVNFQDRRAIEWRRAADRHQRAGHPVTAMMYRNDALRLECEQEGRPLL